MHQIEICCRESGALRRGLNLMARLANGLTVIYITESRSIIRQGGEQSASFNAKRLSSGIGNLEQDAYAKLIPADQSIQDEDDT